MTSEERSLLCLHLQPGISRHRLDALYDHFGSWQAAATASPADRIAAGIPADLADAIPDENSPQVIAALKRLDRLQVRLLTRQSSEYPASLHRIASPPPVLYLRGRIPTADQCLAVVGARRSSAASMNHLQAICRTLAQHDICIVSGLARGADTAAHRGALEANGNTVAVLGCGIDRPYPQENLQLLETLVKDGAVVTEYAPGTPPLPHHFPARNRLISGLSSGVLVSEAAQKSGSLITADFALDQGKEVFVLPGPSYAPQCAGSNDLLKQGAHPVTEATDILEVLWRHRPAIADRHRVETSLQSLSASAQSLFELIGPTPCHIDEITRQSGLTPMEVSATLLDLELVECIKALDGKLYIRTL